MQIERAEFLSNLQVGPQSFNFKPDRLNLLSTDEDQKKADLFSSISLVLWGSPEKNGAALSNLKEGSLEFAVDGKKLLLCRNFETNLLEFKPDEDLKVESTSELLSGISKDMYNSLFLVGQDEGGAANFVDRATLLSLLGQFASVSEHSINIDRSVKLVEEKLDKYPFAGKVYKIDDLIGGLNRGRVVLEERLMQLERERKEASVHIGELNQLEEELARSRRTQKREEYFQLCLETAELDARIMKVQQRLMHEVELKRELTALGDLFDFPISASRKVQELWTMRQSRFSDLGRLEEDIALSNKEAELVQEAYSREAEGLEQFLIEDSQELYSLAKILSTAQEELEQLKADRTVEMRRLKEEGVDFDSISLVRKIILKIDPPDLGEANKLSNEVKWQKDKLANLVALSENTGNQLKVLSGEIALFSAKSRKVKDVLAGLTLVSAVIVVGVFIIHSQVSEVFSTIFLTSFVLSLVGLGFLPRMHASMRRDFEAKIDGIVYQQNKYGGEELSLSDTVASIEARAEKIAKKYELASSADLFKKLQQYSSLSARLKQLDVLDHMLATREQQLTNLSNDAMVYFERINRKLIQVTPAAITGLASEILRHKESSRQLERSAAVLNHRKSERRFLEGEIVELDTVLRDLFRNARLACPDDLETAIEEFEEKAQAYRKWEALNLELQSMEKSLSSEILEHDLSTVLYKLQHRRTDAWTRMQDLIERYPDILTETIEDDEIGRLTLGEAQMIEEGLMQKQARADSLRLIIRSAARNFDEFHPKTQNDLEILERDLDQIKHNKSALTLARDSLMQVAQESKSSWSQELAEISADMLAGAGLEVEKIEWDENMEMTLTLQEHDEPVHESSLARKVPRGLVKQLNWVTRLMLCRYIARRLPLPVVLDEPFCDLDDKRFAGCMNLLVRKILPHCQLIVLTCQRVRHQWFVDRLSEKEKERIQFI